MRVLLFHNPGAGETDHSRTKLMALLRKAGMSATYCSTKDPDLAKILHEPADLFIAAGGDGTVGTIVKGMPDRSIPLAILPLGTANNIARSLGIAGTTEDLVASWRTARKQPFDVGLACGPWGRRLFVEALGVGCMVETMIRLDAVKIDRSDGVAQGRDTLRKVLSEAKPIGVGISIDGRASEEELLLLEVLNIPYGGPNIAWTPAAGIGDGLFDIVSIRSEQRADMVAWLGATQPHVAPPVTLRQGRKISLNWEGSLLRLDDECPSASTRADRVALEPERDPVTILVTEAAEQQRSNRKRQRAKSS